MTQLENLVRIVLVEPAGSLNVGSIARVMKNFGLRQLVLVNPQCNPQSEPALLMAVKARDLLSTAQRVSTLSEALVGCQRIVATTGRVGLPGHNPYPETSQPLEPPDVVLPWLTQPLNGLNLTSAIIFGREDNGLSNEELTYAHRLVYIPSHPAYKSLNLAQAVGICCYELSQAIARVAAGTPQDSSSETVSPSVTLLPAPSEIIEGYYQHLQTLLLKIGYLYPHTANRRMEKLRNLYQRAQPSRQEVAMLRGMLRQMEWALQTDSRLETDAFPPEG